MPRPRTITNEEILDAARELFLQRGPSVSTAEIARRAGISEGTIFKRYPTKDALFMAAMGLEAAADPSTFLKDVKCSGSMKENLGCIARQMLSFFRELIPRVIAMHAHPKLAAHQHGILKGPNSPHCQAHNALSAHLQLEMDAGRLGRGDPELMARVLSASLWNFVFFETIKAQVYKHMEGDDYVDQLVDLLWSGMAPEGDRS